MISKEVLIRLVDELLAAAVAEDEMKKKKDESIDPNSHSYVVHLAKTIKEYVNEQ